MKYIKYILVLLMILLLVGCTSNNIESISYDDFKEKVNDKEDMILFFGEDQVLETTLNTILNENNLTAYKIKISKLSDNEIEELKSYVDYEDTSICFIIKGEDPSVLTHITDTYTTKDKIESQLKALGFIK